MSILRSVRSFVIRRFADESAMLRARQKAESRRQAQKLPHQIYYFHQVDDPYSQLAVQMLADFAARYEVVVQVRVVAAASHAAIHDQLLWKTWARRECALLAPHLGLAYRDAGHEPEIALVDLARRILLAQETSPEFAKLAVAVDTALRCEDLTSLVALAKQHELAPAGVETTARLAKNAALRHRLGHYLSAMFYYAGEWYWGVDRLHYLEDRLDQLGARRAAAATGASVRRDPITASKVLSGRRQQLEFFASLRSPYTHISYQRIAELCQRYPIDLVLRPVIPMMMRGVKADRRKGRYIIFDTAREARRLGIPFGKVWDPLGKPVLRAYSLFPWAREQGRGFEYLQAYSQAVWAERVNAWSEAGLRAIVERAGLNWQQARLQLDNNNWQSELENNVTEMIAAGSWGVPCFRLLSDANHAEFLVWGQDRIWLLELELLRRCA